MSDRLWKVQPTECTYADYLVSLTGPYFNTGQFAMHPWKGSIELKPLNKILAIYVTCQEDFDLACSVLDKTFPEEKKDIEVRFKDGFNI